MILDVTRHLAEQRMVEPLVKYISTTIFEVVPAERTIIVLFDADDALQIAAAVDHHGALIANPETQISHSILDQVRASQSPVLINDALADENLRMSRSVRSLKLRSVICIPLVSHGQTIGAIYLENRQASNQFREEHLIPLILLATQVEIAIENARIYERLESAVSARTSELSKTIEHLRTTQSQLAHSERMAVLGNLVAGVAHELRNPLNFVSNLSKLSVGLVAELMAWLAHNQQGVTAAEQAELHEILGYLSRNNQEIYNSGQRADSIISLMLLHARNGPSQTTPTDVNLVLQQALSLAYHSLRARKGDAAAIMIMEQLQSDLPLVAAQPERLSQALINLCDNACYALWERQRRGDVFAPQLRLITTASPEYVEIRIWDNGAGVAPNLRDRLFEPFVTSKPPGEGTGLGLSLAYDAIVNLHAGKIWFASELSTFTEFTIRLPLRASSNLLLHNTQSEGN